MSGLTQIEIWEKSADTSFMVRFALQTLSFLALISFPLLSDSRAETKDVPRHQFERIQSALQVLARVPAGERLVQQAKRFWKFSQTSDLMAVLRAGPASKTDAVLTRYFNPRTGQETREREVLIYLKTHQTLEELVLDLAHELVHATSRPSWDPYDSKLTAGQYIVSSIDGDGGEVAAVMAECQVALELGTTAGSSSQRCASYLTAERLDREKVRKDFYRVGEWHPELKRRLAAEFEKLELLSSEKAVLFSSTGKTPYPVSLLDEFDELTQVACENTRNRLRHTQARNLATAGPTESFLQERCRK